MNAPDLSFAKYENLIQRATGDNAEAEVDVFIQEFLASPQFNQLQVFSNQAIRILDVANLNYLYLSESNEELTGYPAEVIRKGGLKFINKCLYMIDVVRLTAATLKVKRALSKLSPEQKMRARYSFDSRFICKDGTVKKILQCCHILKLNNANDPHILLFSSTDISAYKQDNRMNYTLSVYETGRGFVNIVNDIIVDGDCPLSEREIEVLRQTSYGFSEKQIADTLNISTETVKTHRKNMLQKVAAKNAVEMVRIAIAKSWI